MPLSGQADIFGMAATGQATALHLPAAEPWLPAERLHREFLAVGFYLSAHPLDEYKAALEKMRVQNWAEFSAAVKRGASAGRLAGTVTTKQERKTRTGNKMGVIQFSDTTGQYEAVLFSEGLAQFRDMLEPGRSVVITVSAEDRPRASTCVSRPCSCWTIWQARCRRRCASMYATQPRSPRCASA